MMVAGAADRGHRAEVVDLELALEVLPPDLGDRREPRRQAGGVEQAVEPAELEHRPAEQRVEAGVVPHVGRDADHPTGELGRQLGGDRLRRGGLEVGHHDVGALFGEASCRRLADAAAAADHHRDVPGQLLASPLAGDRLLHLAPLQRPVLELEDVGLGRDWNRSTASALAMASSVAR